MLHAYCGWGYLYRDGNVIFCKDRVDLWERERVTRSREGEGCSLPFTSRFQYVRSSHPSSGLGNQTWDEECAITKE